MRTRSQFRFVRLATAALAAVVVGGMLVLGMAAPASAVTAPMSFTLKLTSKTGAPLGAYAVYPIQVTDGNETQRDDPQAADPVSGSPGVYTMTVNSWETYTLAFMPVGAAADSGTLQYLGGSSMLAGATIFTPTPDNSFLAASIATGATITGKVTSPTGAALKDAEVDAYQYDGTNWITSNFTETSSSGTFTFANAPPGSYRFEFYSPTDAYPPIFSGSATTLFDATTYFAAVGSKITVNQKFAAGTGSISGSAFVTFDGENIQPDAGRRPIAYPVTQQSGSTATAISTDAAIVGTDANSAGAWTIKNLPAGSYVVELLPGSYGESSVYLSQTMDNADLAHAWLITVTAGHTTSTGSSYFTGSMLDGADPRITVEDASNAPLQDVTVELAPENFPGDVYSGTSIANGTVQLLDPFGQPVFDDGMGDGLDNPMPAGWYTVTAIDAHEGHEPIDAQLQYFDFGTTPMTLNLPDLVASPGFTEDPTIPNTATAVGSPYTVSFSFSREGTTPTYQWLRDGNPIYGATSVSYTSTGADLGHQLSVRVGANSFGFATVYKYAFVGNATPTATTTGSQVANATLPTVTPGSGLYVGSTLTAHPGTWTIDGDPATGLHYSYLWSTGATTSTYVVHPSDIGQDITVTVTASKVGYQDGSAISTNSIVPVDHPAPLMTKSPVVTKTVSGSVTTWTVSSGSWNTSGLGFAYQWQLGTMVVGSNSPKITSTQVGTSLPSADALTVSITPIKDGYAQQASAPVLAVKGTGSFTQNSDPVIHDLTTDADVSGTDCLNFGDHYTITQHGDWGTVGGIAPSGYTYQWYRNGLPVKGATTPNYTITAADSPNLETTQISVVETPVSPFYVTAHGDQTAVGVAMSIDMPSASPKMTVSGAPVVGHTLTASTTGWALTGLTYRYQWTACLVASSCTDPTDLSQFTTIAGATKNTLLLTSGYQAVDVTVTVSKVGYNGEADNVLPIAVNPANTIVLTSAPRISGTTSGIAHVGVKLTALPSAVLTTGTASTIEWQTQNCVPSACDPDSGSWTTVATGSTFTPTAAIYTGGDVSIRVLQTARRSLYYNGVANSPTYALGLGTLKLVKASSLTTTTSLFTINPAVYSPSAGTPTVQWYWDGNAGTTDPSWTRVSADALHAIYVDVTYSVPGYNPITTRTLANRGSTTALPETVINGNYGQTLSLSYPTTAFDDPLHSPRQTTYQWYSNGVAIAHATGPTFTPSSAYIGHHIYARVTGTSALYATGSELSNTITLLAGVWAGPSIPTITNSGTLQPGVVATAVPDTANYGTTGITFHYQWQRSSNAGASFASITGATLSHYTPIATDATEELHVIVTASKTGYSSLTLISAPVTVQYSPTLATLVDPAISGTGKVGSALTVSTGTWNTPTLTYTYQWFRNNVLIGGVTGTSWTPTADSFGDTITVTVTAHRVGWAPAPVQTAPIQVLAADAPVASVAPVITKLQNPANAYTVSTGTWNVDGLTYSYQWQVGGANASGVGATSATFVADGSQSGVLTVIITATRNGYTTAVKSVTGPTLAFE